MVEGKIFCCRLDKIMWQARYAPWTVAWSPLVSFIHVALIIAIIILYKSNTSYLFIMPVVIFFFLWWSSRWCAWASQVVSHPSIYWIRVALAHVWHHRLSDCTSKSWNLWTSGVSETERGLWSKGVSILEGSWVRGLSCLFFPGKREELGMLTMGSGPRSLADQLVLGSVVFWE